MERIKRKDCENGKDRDRILGRGSLKGLKAARPMNFGG